MEEQSGLARSVGAEQGDALSMVDMEIDIVESSMPVGVDVAQTEDFERRLH
jgi:hypothetical protein